MLVPSRLALNYSFSYSCLLVFLRWLEWRITETDGLHPCILLCPSEGHPDVKGASRRYLPRDLSQILLYLPMWFVLLKILTLFQLLLILVWCSWSCWFFSTFFMNGFFFFLQSGLYHFDLSPHFHMVSPTSPLNFFFFLSSESPVPHGFFRQRAGYSEWQLGFSVLQNSWPRVEKNLLLPDDARTWATVLGSTFFISFRVIWLDSYSSAVRNA